MCLSKVSFTFLYGSLIRMFNTEVHLKFRPSVFIWNGEPTGHRELHRPEGIIYIKMQLCNLNSDTFIVQDQYEIEY